MVCTWLVQLYYCSARLCLGIAHPCFAYLYFWLCTITNQLLRRPCPSLANRLKYCGLTLTGVHSHSIVPHRRRRRSDDDYLLLLYLRLCSVLLCGVCVCGGGGGQWWKIPSLQLWPIGSSVFLAGNRSFGQKSGEISNRGPNIHQSRGASNSHHGRGRRTTNLKSRIKCTIFVTVVPTFSIWRSPAAAERASLGS